MARVRHFTLRTAVFLATLNWTVAVVAQVQRFEQGGVALEVSLNGLDETKQLVAGSDAIAKIRISDSASGAPLPGSAPKAWVLAQRSGPLGRDVECADKVRALASGSFGAGADRDLNSYHLLTLNSDKTISVINPQISFSSTKLENLIVLPGNGADWVLSKDKKFLYVSIPGAAAIVIIDTSTRRIISQLSTGDNSAPTQIVLQPDGRIVWVGLDGSGEIVAVDTSNNAMAGRIKVGNGLHKIVFSADSRNVFVSNSSDDTVSIIDSAKMQSVATLIVAKTPVALSYGSVSHLVYAGGINAEIITAIDADARRIVAEIPVKRGISVLRFEPTGRFAFAINQLESNVSVIDSATSTITSQVQVVDDPDQITFTRRYAYIRGLGSEKFTLLDLNEIRAGKAAPVDIQAGPLAPSVLPEEIGSASMIAAAPDGSSVMIASAPDATIYYYQEGMMAASGTFSNYKRAPHGLLVLDRGMTETAPGEYTTIVPIPAEGSLEMPVLIDRPQVVACFQFIAMPARSLAAPTRGPRFSVEPMFTADALVAGIPITLAFRISNSAGGAQQDNQPNLAVKIFKIPDQWQRHAVAHSIGGGIYELTLTFPGPGQYQGLFIAGSAESRGATQPHVSLTIH